MKLGMAYLPEDRKAEGIIADLSVRENIIIALQAKRGMFHPLSRKEMDEAADKYIKLLQIKTASRETPIKSLSGGNQQKVILGRWLLTNPDYLILDEPPEVLISVQRLKSRNWFLILQIREWQLHLSPQRLRKCSVLVPVWQFFVTVRR